MNQNTCTGTLSPPQCEETIDPALRSLLQRSDSVTPRRSLIREIVALQLIIAAIVGALALAGLSWASNLSNRNTMREWGEQWLDNLEELSAPLYVSGNERYARIADYIDEFTEIAYVRYYADSGEPVFSQVPNGAEPGIAPLDPQTLAEVASRPAHDERYILNLFFLDNAIVRISQPVWARRVLSDGMFGFDPDSTDVGESLLGYVELGLNFSDYQGQLVRAVQSAVLVGVVGLVLLTLTSCLIYTRALRPLAKLRVSLKMLADGKVNLKEVISGHPEIVEIADAFDSAVRTLKERDRELSQIANHDPLTGLINRQRFSELLASEVQSAGKDGRAHALLYIDLDQFKYVIDSFGYSGGDRLLKLAAARIVGCLRAEDIVARFAGDEFIVFLRDVNKRNAEDVCTTLIERIQEEPFLESGQSVSIRCSIGATMIRGKRYTPAELLAQADVACHQAKMNGRNRFHFYRASSKEVAEMAADASWSQLIQTALKEDAFVLHYQPIVDLRTRRTVYYEVLLRMLLDEDKLAPPAEFLPVAARFGLTVDIDRWVIRNALQSLAQLRAANGDIRFTINLSGDSFGSPDCFDYLLHHLQANSLPLDAIVIEITEQIALGDLDTAAAQMAALASRGCRFAIDDFGSGYCSYSYLRSLPIAFVKIDGSFIANLGEDEVNRKIVSAISQTARAAKCETVAEHVEDYETLLLVRKLGVTHAQGYFVGRPASELSPGTLPVPFGERSASAIGAPARRRTRGDRSPHS